MRAFDQETMALIAAFERMTGTEVRDCIRNDAVYFLVNPGKAAAAIGKGGQNVQNAENLFKKPIKIYEWAENEEQFIRNIIPGIKKLEMNGEKAVVTVDSKERGAVIGKGGSNISVLRELLARNSRIKELKIL
jgi:N utilization substance protein A